MAYDLTNQRFGKLKVIKKSKKKSNRGIIWECLCDCGNICEVCSTDLRKQDTKSCGCLQRETRHKKLIDISNQIFNYLYVIEQDIELSELRGQPYWKCKCLRCNKIKSIKGAHIKDGSIKSCGCLKSYPEEYISKILKDNKINFIQQYSFKDLYGNNHPLYFDFAIFMDNTLSYLIEYQGDQHFHPVDYWGGDEKFQQQLKYDKLKKEYCKQHNIELIILSGNEYKQTNLYIKEST